MDRQEFLRRRRALEELYQADLRLLRAAHEARVRSLEALWMDLQPDALPPPGTILLSAVEEAPATPPIPELPEPAEAEVVPSAPDLPDTPSKNPDLRTAVEEILPELPAVFEKKDVLEALGWTPSRSSLHRVLSDLELAGLLKFETYSQGRTPSRYRRL